MVYGPGLLPFWLTAIGFSFVFVGTGWALLKWSSRPTIVRTWTRTGKSSDIVLPGDSLSDDSIGSDDLETFGSERTRAVGRGVQAIFTSSQKERITISRTLLVAIVEVVGLIALYAGLVQEYSTSLGMQSWVRSNFSFGQYFLNYDAVLVLTGLIAVISFRFLPWRRRSSKVIRRTNNRRRR